MLRWHLLLTGAVTVVSLAPLRAEPLPETKPLTRDGDLAAQMVEGIDKYLMRELAASVENRKQFFKPDFSSEEAYERSLRRSRERLKKIIGVVDPRISPVVMEYIGEGTPSPLVAETDTHKIYSVRWPVLPGVDGEGLLLEPKGKVEKNVVALPDADWTPEMLVGLAPGMPPDVPPFGPAQKGVRVIVPVLIDRKDTWSGNPNLGRLTNQPHREFIYRMAYEMGRHIIGYEVQKVLAAVDWITGDWITRGVGKPEDVIVFGYGEGGLLALYSAALDPRIDFTLVSGYFGPREGLWQEPIYRNVFGLLHEFGDGELAGLSENQLWVYPANGPRVDGPPPVRANRGGAAPGKLLNPTAKTIQKEFERGMKLDNPFKGDWLGLRRRVLPVEIGKPLFGSEKPNLKSKPPVDNRKNFDPAPRQKRQFDQLVAFTQKLMRDSERYRQQHFWAKLDTSSLEKYQKSCEPFRKQLWEEVLGKLPDPNVSMNPQTRQIYDEPKWKGYEVTLDLYPDVFAYGILLLPKDLKSGEKRPVVVCQHGLEGRPTDVCNPKERTKYYNSFGAQLADRGYIVYAPQNPYIGQDKFRVLQRKANPLGLSLFSFIVRQHERTLDWLATLPNVDAEHMAFYGLSYGGKTAMRVPALLPRYCLSICSGDFNEWIRKNVSLDYPSSYMFSGEYEMPEFNLGHTFNYAEMAALIAPRPFMVERGHDDGVGIDEWIAYEYAKVRRLYSRLKIPDRTEIEFFPGGHEIHGQGTFRFLQKHLNWPK